MNGLIEKCRMIFPRAEALLLYAVSFTIVVGLAGCQSKPDEIQGSAESAAVPDVTVTKVEQHTLNRLIKLPGELISYRDVPIFPKVKGFVQWIGVDRGSQVKAGQKIIKLYAPELESDVRRADSEVQVAVAALRETQSKLESSQAQLNEGEAEYLKYKATAERMEKASKTPGVVALNDVHISEKTADAYEAKVKSLNRLVDAQRSLVSSAEKVVDARKHELESLKTMQSYLVVTAPFDGVITERNVHEGSLVSSAEESTVTSFSSTEAASASGSATPSSMVRLRQNNRLRLVVPVPEVVVAGVKAGDQVEFTVPAYPERKFTSAVARIGNYLDRTTRTMPVELDVLNAGRELEPGMYSSVLWRMTRPYPTLFVPESAVIMSLERTFAVRVAGGVEEIVDVTRGQPMGSSIEVLETKLKPGDMVALRASDDMKSGAKVRPVPASAEDLEAAGRRTSAKGE